MKKTKSTLYLVVLSLILLLTACDGINPNSTSTDIEFEQNKSSEEVIAPTPIEELNADNEEDILDQFTKETTKQDVIDTLGENFTNDGNDMIYDNIELCGMKGSLSVEIPESHVNFLMWRYDAGGRKANECSSEMQIIYDHFVSKFGEAEIREFSTRSAAYIWHRDENKGPAGSPQYVLDFDDTSSKIRVYVNFDA